MCVQVYEPKKIVVVGDKCVSGTPLAVFLLKC